MERGWDRDTSRKFHQFIKIIGDSTLTTRIPSRVIPIYVLDGVKALHEKELREGYGETALPYALDVKYSNAGREWIWQYVFPASQRSTDPRSGAIRRHHLDESMLQRAVREAANRARLTKPVSPQPFRHSFATHFCKTATIFEQCKNC